MSPDAAPKPDYEALSPGTRLVAVAFLLCTLWYLNWRATTLNPDAYLFSWLVYGAELFGFLGVLLHLFMIWRLSVRRSLPVPADKTVDVFIPTINEPVSIVRHTLLAALHMDYPHETWLLDDGNRPEIARLARELGAHYLARGDNRDAKAGNLNHALQHSKGEYIAIFDADHAPQRHFLERTLGYFSNSRVAFVQTPQDFYNLDSYQHRRSRHGRRIWTEQSLFFRVIQRGKDYWNAAFFCGSCAVLRRSALESIGGFATGTVTEDLHTSLRLHMKRYSSVYHAEPLAFGLAPDTVGAFLGQRIRWGEGAMKVWRTEGLLFNRDLTVAQRLNYLASVLTYFDGWQKLVFYAAPAIVLLTGLLPIRTTVESFVLHFVPYFVLTLWIFEESARGYGNFLQTEEYNLARFHAFARATVGWLGGGRKFRVTPKDSRTGKSEQLRMIPQYLVFSANLLAIPAGYLLYQHHQWLPAGAVVANIVWASVNVWLAYSLLSFTMRKHHQRRDYRFGLPVPVMVCQGGKCRYGTIDDVSSSGFRLDARLEDKTRLGERLSGELWLPGRRLPFAAIVRHLIRVRDDNGEHVRAYGCQFDWQDGTLHDQLDRYLFGSGLQWQLQGLSEGGRTPLQWFSIMRHHGRDDRTAGPPRWATFLYRMPGAAGSEEMAGLIEINEPERVSRRLLLYHPLNEGTMLSGRVITLSSENNLTLCAGTVTRVETQLEPIFLISADVHFAGYIASEPGRMRDRVDTEAGDQGRIAALGGPDKRSLP